jgi:hypothetical protein
LLLLHYERTNQKTWIQKSKPNGSRRYDLAITCKVKACYAIRVAISAASVSCATSPRGTGEDDDDDDGTRFSFVTFDPNDGTFGDLLPPLAVVKWAGLPAPDPTVSDSSLTVWNDYDGASFDEIAALIEKHL